METQQAVIGRADLIDEGVVRYLVFTRNVDGTALGDTRDIVGIDDFAELGFKLDGELKNVGDSARILAA